MSISLKSIYEKILETVTNDRQKTHGEPTAQLSHTASMWGAYLGLELTGIDVAFLNQLQKMSRHKHGQLNVDDFDDNIGYAGIAALFAYKQKNMEGGICSYPGCGVMLRKFSKGDSCNMHMGWKKVTPLTEKPVIVEDDDEFIL